MSSQYHSTDASFSFIKGLSEMAAPFNTMHINHSLYMTFAWFHEEAQISVRLPW
jgi:hypothetical protein